ncbi:hypothetical protein A3F66_03970 [candidate division TM6 bacterium RIFCSPHIGHO2_12_FULL_32_22]|nr:MAG: hypothetical protein A3F66_03970 [candidate division TM6 bacterium RIFCSPHIGHO2_12_FULL_32_22]
MKLLLINLFFIFSCISGDLSCDRCELSSSIINGPATIYPCGHKFHKGCIDNHIFREQDGYRRRYCGCRRNGPLIVEDRCPVSGCHFRLNHRDVKDLDHSSYQIFLDRCSLGGTLTLLPILFPCIFGTTLCRE